MHRGTKQHLISQPYFIYCKCCLVWKRLFGFDLENHFLSWFYYLKHLDFVKIESCQNFIKNIPLVLFLKEGHGSAWGWPGGPTIPPHHMVARQAFGRAWAWCGAHLVLHHFSHLPLPCLARPKTIFILKLMYLLFLLTIFDLLAQPIFAAEIWSVVPRCVTPPFIQVEFCLV